MAIDYCPGCGDTAYYADTTGQQKPVLRPTRPISNEAGRLVNMVAKCWIAMGSVASAFSSASAKPINALAVIISELQLIINAWQDDSKSKFFREWRM